MPRLESLNELQRPVIIRPGAHRFIEPRHRFDIVIKDEKLQISSDVQIARLALRYCLVKNPESETTEF